VARNTRLAVPNVLPDSPPAQEFVTCALGYKNTAGAWVVNERVEVQCFETGISQLVITPDLDGRPGYNLTHVQSGFRALGPFTNLTTAREAAVRLAKLFPIEEWNAMGQMAEAWKRGRLKIKFRNLPLEDQEWMRQNGARF
jgi:hypothetical protein